MGKTAFESLLSKGPQNCVQFVEQYMPHVATQQPTDLKIAGGAGGEDTSMLEGVLLQKMQAWNDSLPPFDNAFYYAISCEPAFEKNYQEVQDISLNLHASPNDRTLLAAWEQVLENWRKCVVISYVSLINPHIWAQNETVFGRTLPKDVVKNKSNIMAVWKLYPDVNQKRNRLEAIEKFM